MFDSTRDSAAGDLYVMGADGADPTRVTDGLGAFGPDWGAIVDDTPPTVTCSASPATLRSNRHKLASITATVTVTDEPGGSGADGFTLVSVQSSQADSGLAADDVANDIQGWTVGTANTSGLLRTERYGADRLYTLTYEGRDKAGHTATCRTTVTIKRGT